MTQHRTLFASFASFLFIATLLSTATLVVRGDFVSAEEPKAKPEAVEADMHEFMEYMFEPAYKRLKVAMANEPADGRAWKPVKGDSLVLAEACNLLMQRGPDGKEEAWSKLAVAARADGALLYQAAKKRDFTAATKHYRAMISNCNQCHNVFADGEHQLTP